MPIKLNKKEPDRKARQGTPRGRWDHRTVEWFGLERIWKIPSSLSLWFNWFSPSALRLSAHLLCCSLSLHSCSSSMHRESFYLVTPFHLQHTRSSEHISHLPFYFSPHTYFQAFRFVSFLTVQQCTCTRPKALTSVPTEFALPSFPTQTEVVGSEAVSLRWKDKKSFIFPTPKIKAWAFLELCPNTNVSAIYFLWFS